MIILIALVADFALFDRLADQAAWVVAMGTVAEFAATEVAAELDRKSVV